MSGCDASTLLHLWIYIHWINNIMGRSAPSNDVIACFDFHGKRRYFVHLMKSLFAGL